MCRFYNGVFRIVDRELCWRIFPSQVRMARSTYVWGPGNFFKRRGPRPVPLVEALPPEFPQLTMRIQSRCNTCLDNTDLLKTLLDRLPF